MSGRSPPCGIPLQRFTKYFGIVDVGLGAISVAVMGLYLSLNESDDVETTRITIHSRRTSTIPPELALVVLVTAAVQCIMGIVLIVGAVRGHLHFLAVITLLTGYFPLRLFELYVVFRFIQELKEEQQVAQFKRHPNAYPQGIQHNTAMLIQQYPPVIGLQKSNLDMSASPNIIVPKVHLIGGVTTDGDRKAYSMLFSHQQNQPPFSGVKLNEIQDGKRIHSQFPPQLPHNSESQKMGPSSQQSPPPPKYSYF